MSDGVSVVVPTTGRPELLRAVDSALMQRDAGVIEVVVVDDSGSDALLDLEGRAGVTVVKSAGRTGSSAARNLGVRAATQPWIAFLDDDDQFLPGKLRRQKDAAQSLVRKGVDPIVASPVVQRAGDRVVGPIPERIYQGGDVAAYLFRNRRPGAGRASAYTSTLFCSSALARRARWDESLRRHTDWDWLIRATALDGVALHQLDEPLVEIQANSEGSISAQSDWQSSLQWAECVLRTHDRKTFVDFVAAQPARYAISARSLTGLRRCAAAITRARRLPGPGPCMIAVAGVLPRSALERVMRVVR